MGGFLKAVAFLIYFGGGLMGTYVCLKIVVDALGFIGGAIAFFLFPVTLAFAPWYAALSYGDWLPFQIVYGTVVVATSLFGLGSLFDRGE